jgi:hypothetical protein
MAGEVPEVPNVVTWGYYAIPIGNHLIVHFLDIFKWTMVKLDVSLTSKMSITSKSDCHVLP